MTSVLVALLLFATPGADTLKLPARLDGWRLSGVPTKYTPETLFEYIDGGAEAFLQFDFQELIAATYVNAEENELRVDVYRHRDATRAFGIYSQERRPGSPKMPGSLEGVASADHLEFVAGAYYVKLALLDGGDAVVLPKIARKLSASLPGPRALPPALGWFPAKGKVPRAEKLSAHDFLGHAFLHDATAVPYQIAGVSFRLFVVEGTDAADVAKMVRSFRKIGKLSEAEVGPSGALTIDDPLNGKLSFMWRGRWLWGVVDDPSLRGQALVEALGRSLPKR